MKKVKKTLLLPKELARVLERGAKRHGIPQSALVGVLLTDFGNATGLITLKKPIMVERRKEERRAENLTTDTNKRTYVRRAQDRALLSQGL